MLVMLAAMEEFCASLSSNGREWLAHLALLLANIPAIAAGIAAAGWLARRYPRPETDPASGWVVIPGILAYLAVLSVLLAYSPLQRLGCSLS